VVPYTTGCSRGEGCRRTRTNLQAADEFSGPLRELAGCVPRHPELDWREIAAMLEEAFRSVAPKRLVGELEKR